MREEHKQLWLLQKKTQERDKNDRFIPTTIKTIIKVDLPSACSLRVMQTTMKTIMKMDLPIAKSRALRRPQRGADTCDYGLQQVILHGNIVGHVTAS
jgi:hypothetical protein